VVAKRLTKEDVNEIIEKLKSGKDPSAIADELVSKYNISKRLAVKRVKRLLSKMQEESTQGDGKELKRVEEKEKAGEGRTTVEADALRLLKKEVAETIKPWVENEAYFSKLTSELGKRVFFHLINAISNEKLRQLLEKPPEVIAEELSNIAGLMLSGSSDCVKIMNDLEMQLDVASFKLDLCRQAVRNLERERNRVLEMARTAISLLDEAQVVKYAALLSLTSMMTPAPIPQQQVGEKGGEEAEVK